MMTDEVPVPYAPALPATAMLPTLQPSSAAAAHEDSGNALNADAEKQTATAVPYVAAPQGGIDAINAAGRRQQQRLKHVPRPL